MNKTNKTDNQEFAQIFWILLECAKEKRISAEEVDMALFTGDREELLFVLRKVEGASRHSVK